MTSIALNSLRFSIQFGFDFHLVKSWFEHMNFASFEEAKSFFDTNKKMINATPFVKWVGGKRQIMPQLKKLFPTEFNNYHEPFLGGGAVFFALQKKQSFLSDVNAELINTYQVIKDKPKKLIKFLETCNHSKDFYTEIRAWDRQENWQENFTDVQRAGRFIYLNRTCFNGLYRVNSKGQFNVPIGSYANPDFVQKENITNVSKLLKETKAIIKLQSFKDVLKNAKSGDFVYFDPPYDTLSETANFTSYNESGFARNMQIELRDVFVKLDKMGCKVMMSNHNTDFIREIYSGFKFEIVKARRNVNSNGAGRGEVEEIVVMNY
ncbi:MAG: DNA adenine methylase [Candidatus Gracilibacteria bacterium]|nr:DNA adenine methylase [Candidatus Gracilibacteria bacterium]